MAAKKTEKRKYTKRSDKWSNGANGAPEGFEKVEGAHISGFWVPNKVGDSVRGVLGDLITKAPDKDGRENSYNLLTLNVDDIGGDVIAQDPKTKRKFKAVVGSGMVIALSGRILISRVRGRSGNEAYIVYKGLGDEVKGRNQARLYDVYIRPVRS